MTTHKHETRKLTELTIHPFLKDSPILRDDHPDMRNLVDAMASDGLADHPIIINDSNQIMDGRHRARGAAILNWSEIPVIVKPETQAVDIITHAVLARRHLLKWQVAYTLAPVLQRYFEKGSMVGRNNLIPGNKSAKKPNVSRECQVDTPEKSPTLLLERAGISRETWFRVKEVLKRFEKRPDLRAQYEPRMFLPDSDENAISLEGVMKALGSIESYEQNHHPVKALRDEHDRLALDLMKKAAAQLEFFDKLEPAKQKKLAEEAVQAVRLWPIELKKELLSALQQDFISEQKSRKIK